MAETVATAPPPAPDAAADGSPATLPTPAEQTERFAPAGK